MRIRAYKYIIPLKKPLCLKSGPFHEKKGFIIRLDRDGKTGWGEVSPIDGYSPETFAQVEQILPSILVGLSDTATALSEDVKYPSLACGISWALSQLNEVDDNAVYRAETTYLIHDPDDDNFLSSAARAVVDGHTCLKVKVGRNTVEEDVKQVRKLLSILPDSIQLRLDANRSWTLEQALLFSRSVDPENIAFIEEPLIEDDAYEAYNRQTQIPYALDESLQWRSYEDLNNCPRLGALVLKPSLLGGTDKIAKWVWHAEARGIYCVLSSMFETGVGMRALTKLAATTAFHSTPAGLDTYRSLVHDITSPPLKFLNGAYVCTRSWKLDEEKVEKIYDNN